MFSRGQRYIIGILFLLSVITNAQAVNIQISGTLIEDPCSIVPSHNQIVDFKEITDRELYRSDSTEVPFSIDLKDCSSALIKTLTIKFSGNESRQQPGLLTLDASSQASGIAIGIESNGIALPINGQQGITFPFQNGDDSLPFKAYVKAGPDAVTQKNIKLGPFTATTTFMFEYN